MTDTPNQTDNRPDEEDDDDDEPVEGSEVEGIEHPPEVTPPAQSMPNEELLRKIVLELGEIKTSLTLLHLKMNHSLGVKLAKWFYDKRR